MKAVVCTEYGSPDVLKIMELPKPAPKDNEALVKVMAASANAADLELLRGEFMVRMAGPRKPMYKILGTDIAGRLEAVGRNVTRFQPGDEIWADLSQHGWGAYAEYVCVPEEALRPKPAAMTFEEAAAYPQAAVLALQNLRAARPSKPGLLLPNSSQIQPGQKVLINGAGGGVGTFAVQIAKHYGAEVTGVDSELKLDMLRSIGADHIVDYAKEDFTKSGRRYDLIVDVVARRPIFAYRRALKPKGICVFTGGTTAAIFQSLLLAPLISMAGDQKLGVVMWKPNNQEDMALLAELFESGEVVPVIDKRYPLGEVPEALRYLGEGRALGKVVITNDQDTSNSNRPGKGKSRPDASGRERGSRPDTAW